MPDPNDYSDLLQGEPQRQSRADILYNTLIPNYLKYQQPSPMPPPGTPPGKIGPPSGNPSLGEMVAKGLPDIASFAAPEAKLGATALSKLEPSLAAMFLVKRPGMRFFHDIYDDTGKKVGGAQLNYLPERNNTVWINSIYSDKPGKSTGSFGLSDTRSLLEALKNRFPDAETVSGRRVSGARKGTSKEGEEVSIRIRPTFEERQVQELNDPIKQAKMREIVRQNIIKSGLLKE